jgi:hypothetical protein
MGGVIPGGVRDCRDNERTSNAVAAATRVMLNIFIVTFP